MNDQTQHPYPSLVIEEDFLRKINSANAVLALLCSHFTEDHDALRDNIYFDLLDGVANDLVGAKAQFKNLLSLYYSEREQAA